MLKLSKLSDYAIVILQYLAMRQGLANVQEISQTLKLPVPTVSKLLKILNKKQLTESIRGVQGGYRLKQAATQITLAQIIHAVEGQLALTECSLAQGLCEHDPFCMMRENWRVINQILTATLGQLSLMDLSQPLTRHGAMAQLLTVFENHV